MAQAIAVATLLNLVSGDGIFSLAFSTQKTYFIIAVFCGKMHSGCIVCVFMSAKTLSFFSPTHRVRLAHQHLEQWTRFSAVIFRLTTVLCSPARKSDLWMRLFQLNSILRYINWAHKAQTYFILCMRRVAATSDYI